MTSGIQTTPYDIAGSLRVTGDHEHVSLPLPVEQRGSHDSLILGNSTKTFSSIVAELEEQTGVPCTPLMSLVGFRLRRT